MRADVTEDMKRKAQSTGYRLDPFNRERVRMHSQLGVEGGKLYESQGTTEFRSARFVADSFGKGVRGRSCDDYRNLTRLLEALPTPQHSTSAQLERASRFILHTKADALECFNQLQLGPSCRELFAVTDGKTKWVPRCVGFGWRDAPGHCQARMGADLATCTARARDSANIFIDGLDIGSMEAEGSPTSRSVTVTERGVDEHSDTTAEVFGGMWLSGGWVWSLEKTEVCKRSAPLLGMRLNDGLTSPDEKHRKLIENAAPPKSLDEVTSYKCLCLYLKNFFPQFAALASPLDRFSAKTATWGEFLIDKEANRAVELIRKNLAMVGFGKPVPDCPYTLMLDACQIGWGYVLLQYPEFWQKVQDGADPATTDLGQPHLVTASSGSFKNYSLFWTVTPKEFFALRQAIMDTRELVGFQGVLVCTDHANNLFPKKGTGLSKRESRKLIGWALDIEAAGGKYTIVHVAGEENTTADWLSRFPVDAVAVRALYERLSVERTPVREMYWRVFGKTLPADWGEFCEGALKSAQDKARVKGKERQDRVTAKKTESTVTQRATTVPSLRKAMTAAAVSASTANSTTISSIPTSCSSTQLSFGTTAACCAPCLGLNEEMQRAAADLLDGAEEHDRDAVRDCCLLVDDWQAGPALDDD